MTRKQAVLLLGIVGGIAAAALLGFVVDFTPHARINRKAYDDIYLGMPYAEVEDLLGEPREYFTEPPGSFYRADHVWMGPYELVGDRWGVKGYRFWSGDRGGIRLGFDRQDRVVIKMYSFPNKKIRWWGDTLGETNKPDSGYNRTVIGTELR